MRPTTPPVVRLQRPASLESANLTTIHLDDDDDSSPLLMENGATSESDHTTWKGVDEVQGTDGTASTEQSRPWLSCLQGRARIAVFVLVGAAILGLVVTAGLTINWRKYGIELYLVRSAADDYTTQATPLLGTGRLQNMMFGYCVSLNIPEPPGKPPAEDYLRSVLCDKTEYRPIQLYFRYNFDMERLETVDGDCIVPMEPVCAGGFAAHCGSYIVAAHVFDLVIYFFSDKVSFPKN